MENNITELGC